MRGRRAQIFPLVGKFSTAGEDSTSLAEIERELRKLPKLTAISVEDSYYERAFDLFGVAQANEPSEEDHRKLGWLLASQRVRPDWLEDADTAHMALWAVRSVLGVSPRDLADMLTVSVGRVSQFMKPTERIPRDHRFLLLGVLDRAIEEWSAEVRVEYGRQKSVRAARTKVLQLLTAIRDAEQEALLPTRVKA